MLEVGGLYVDARRRIVLVFAGLGRISAAVWDTVFLGALKTAGGFTDPGSQSQRAADLAARAFGRDTADVVVLYRSPALTVHDAAYRTAVTQTLPALPRDRVTSTATYWSTGSAQFATQDGHQTHAGLRLPRAA